jgi:hypothetical protein
LTLIATSAENTPIAQFLAHQHRKDAMSPIDRGVPDGVVDPLAHWRAQERDQPRLAMMAYFYTLRLATSVECERGFSNLRTLTGLFRHRLLTVNAKNEIIIRTNPDDAYIFFSRGVTHEKDWAFEPDPTEAPQPPTEEELAVDDTFDEEMVLDDLIEDDEIAAEGADFDDEVAAEDLDFGGD